MGTCCGGGVLGSGEYSTLITGVGGVCGYMLWGRGIRER